jgi:glycosyltransferase involved in cell wall biosynthesis
MVWLLRNPIPVVGSFNNHLSSELLLSKGFKKIKLIASILLLRLFLSKSQGIISVSQGVADDLKSYLGFKYNNIFHVVYNPVITSDTFEKINQPLRSLPVPKNVQWILYAGRLVHAKGLDLLVKAFRLISNKTNAHLIIMGNGPLQSEITCIAKEAGLEDRIHLVGFQTNALPWMRAADVFVLPSRHEGLPNVLIEALACGTQIVANDCPSGPAEILDNGKYGQLVPVENPKALGQALLLSLSGAFQVAAQELQKRANYFSAEKAARIYLAVLKNEQQKF